MKNTMLLYCKESEEKLERAIPLKFVGQRNKKLGFSNDFHILVMDGFNKMSDAYKGELKDLGFHLHDVSAMYKSIEKEFLSLGDYSFYALNTFLRWLVIDEFFKGEPTAYYDGDIVFNVDPAEIAKKVEGLTFVLQGCPAFTVISDWSWFKQYKQELVEFLKDRDGYQKKAWQERSDWEVTFATKWAGSRAQEKFVHDQDFISHLIHTKKLVQDPIEKVMRALSDYVVFQNPLLIHSYNTDIPYTYSRENGIDYLSYARSDLPDVTYKKPVLFWHMQNCFNFYMSKYIFRKRVAPFLPLGRVEFDFGHTVEDKVNKFARRFSHHTERRAVYEYFFEKHDFSGVFNNAKWWKQGVFK